MFILTVSYDGKPAHWEKTYTDFSAAVAEYEKINDWGFADEFAIATLRIPAGAVASKTLRRPN